MLSVWSDSLANYLFHGALALRPPKLGVGVKATRGAARHAVHAVMITLSIASSTVGISPSHDDSLLFR